MVQITEGAAFTAQVYTVNRFGNPISPQPPLPTDIAVVDNQAPTLGTVAVTPAGRITFTAAHVIGQGNIVAKGTGLQDSSPYSFTVAADATPFGLAILPS